MPAHLKTEGYLKSLKSKNIERPDEKLLTFITIREGIYSESFPTFTGSPDLQDLPEELKIPHDASGPGIAFAKIDDLREATAKLVEEYLDGTTYFNFRDQVILLSGPRVGSLAEAVKLLGNSKGKEIRFKKCQ